MDDAVNLRSWRWCTGWRADRDRVNHRANRDFPVHPFRGFGVHREEIPGRARSVRLVMASFGFTTRYAHYKLDELLLASS
jgi:hypothetical protein